MILIVMSLYVLNGETMFKRFLLALTMLTATAMSYATITREEISEIDKKSKKMRQFLDEVVKLSKDKHYAEGIKLIDKRINLVKKEIKDKKLKDKLVSFMLSLRGEFNYFLRNYDEAISDCGAALLIDENNGIAYYIKGHAYAEKGNQSMAILCIRKAANLGLQQAQDEVVAYNL